MKRLVPTCAPDHECTDEEIWAIGEEVKAVEEDENILKYDRPDVDIMREVVAKAETYTGDWYHTQITVDEKHNPSEEYTKLRERILELGADHGLYIYFYLGEIDSFDFAKKLEPEQRKRMEELWGIEIPEYIK